MIRLLTRKLVCNLKLCKCVMGWTWVNKQTRKIPKLSIVHVVLSHCVMKVNM